MRSIKPFRLAKWIFAFTLMTVLFACSSRMDNNVTPPTPTKAELLVNGGKWVTTAGTLVKADGTTRMVPSRDPFFDSILLGDVTFYADGTAVESNNPGGLTSNGLTWQLTGSNLLVHINFNGTDKVNANITYLSENKLVMEVTDFYQYDDENYVKLIQTLTH